MSELRIDVDYGRCEGHGICADLAPAVFGLDDDAELTFRFDGEAVPAEHDAPARAAVASCPVAALRVST